MYIYVYRGEYICAYLHSFKSLPYSLGRVPVKSRFKRKSKVSNLVKFEYSTGNVPIRFMKDNVIVDKFVIKPNSVGKPPTNLVATLISNDFIFVIYPISVGNVPDKNGTSPKDKVSWES
jgi:hypothetical protein